MVVSKFLYLAIQMTHYQASDGCCFVETWGNMGLNLLAVMVGTLFCMQLKKDLILKQSDIYFQLNQKDPSHPGNKRQVELSLLWKCEYKSQIQWHRNVTKREIAERNSRMMSFWGLHAWNFERKGKIPTVSLSSDSPYLYAYINLNSKKIES